MLQAHRALAACCRGFHHKSLQPTTFKSCNLGLHAHSTSHTNLRSALSRLRSRSQLHTRSHTTHSTQKWSRFCQPVEITIRQQNKRKLCALHHTLAQQEQQQQNKSNPTQYKSTGLNISTSGLRFNAHLPHLNSGITFLRVFSDGAGVVEEEGCSSCSTHPS